jgi:hypothetical protein
MVPPAVRLERGLERLQFKSNHRPLHPPLLVDTKTTIHIDPDKESAEAHLRTISQLDNETAQFYTDGSGIKDEIGAVMYCQMEKSIQQRYLGRSSGFNGIRRRTGSYPHGHYPRQTPHKCERSST